MGRRARRGNNSTYVFDYACKVENYLQMFLNIAMSSFRWLGLPDTCNERWLEYTLLKSPAVFTKDDIAGAYVNLAFTGNRAFDIYNNPVGVTAAGANGYTSDVIPAEKCVVIYENRMRTNMLPTLQSYAMELAHIDQIMYLNANAQKMPYIFKGDEKEKLSMQNIFMAVDCGQPAIYLRKNLSQDSFDVLNLNAPYLCDRLTELKQTKYAEALSLLGIYANANDKAERKIVSEVATEIGITYANRLSRTKAREDAAEEINRKFDLDISVEFIGDAVPLDTLIASMSGGSATASADTEMSPEESKEGDEVE